MHTQYAHLYEQQRAPATAGPRAPKGKAILAIILLSLTSPLNILLSYQSSCLHAARLYPTYSSNPQCTYSCTVPQYHTHTNVAYTYDFGRCVYKKEDMVGL